LIEERSDCMVSTKKYYVAYGSNLNLEQMVLRCPDARIYSSGILKNWELIYRGKHNNAHATIRRKAGSTVPVLVWEITEKDEQSLDRCEGFPVYYFKQNVRVILPDTKTITAMVYIMDKSKLPGLPSKKYANTIYKGYLDNSFDTDCFFDSLKKSIKENKKGFS